MKASELMSWVAYDQIVVDEQKKQEKRR